MSDIADAVLPALAARHAPQLSSGGQGLGGTGAAVAAAAAAAAAAAVATSPASAVALRAGTGAIGATGCHRYALSSEPVLALTQLHQAAARPQPAPPADAALIAHDRSDIGPPGLGATDDVTAL